VVTHVCIMSTCVYTIVSTCVCISVGTYVCRVKTPDTQKIQTQNTDF